MVKASLIGLAAWFVCVMSAWAKPAQRVQVPCTEGYRADRLMRTVAWAGETPKDPNGGIYSWVVDNPEPEKEVAELTFRNRVPKGEFVLLAVTAEREAK